MPLAENVSSEMKSNSASRVAAVPRSDSEQQESGWYGLISCLGLTFIANFYWLYLFGVVVLISCAFSYLQIVPWALECPANLATAEEMVTSVCIWRFLNFYLFPYGGSSTPTARHSARDAACGSECLLRPVYSNVSLKKIRAVVLQVSIQLLLY